MSDTTDNSGAVDKATPPTLGRVAILAGGGALPLMIAASVRRRGGTVHMVAIEGFAGADIEAYPHTWINLGQANRMLRALKGPADGRGPNVMVIAGAVKRPDLMKLRPDFGFFRVAGQLLKLITAGGDDALLTRTIRIFENEGLTVVGVQDVAPELLIGKGPLGRHAPDAEALADMAVAGRLLTTLGALDVGQGAVVEQGRVIAIEGAEGTDAMLARVKALGTRGRAILMKAPKPGQERRVDLPTIGLQTMERCTSAGIRGIAIVPGLSIGLQREAMAAHADANGAFVYGLPGGLAALGGAREAIVPHLNRLQVLGKVRPADSDILDATRGAEVVVRLLPFGAGRASAVVRGHVLGVTAAEAPADLMARLGGLSQWGLKRLQKRRGAFVVRADGGLTGTDLDALLRGAASGGFGGIAVVTSGTDTEPLPGSMIAMADAKGLFLARINAD